MKMLHKYILVLPMFLFSFVSCQKEKTSDDTPLSLERHVTTPDKPTIDSVKTLKKATEALAFCRQKGYNTDFCILADISLHSGVYRLMVFDFKTNTISKKYLVGHGCGEQSWSSDGSKDNPKFSNLDGSHLSSLGKYKIGARGPSDWGIHIKYIMHGLESTNSNAVKRFIVFHSWELMSDEEVFPIGSPEGWGCPTVSNEAMKEIDPMLQASKKPVLFWMYQ